MAKGCGDVQTRPYNNGIAVLVVMGLDQWMSAEQASSVFPPTGVRRIRGPGSLLFRQGLQRMHPIPALCLRFTGGLRQQNLEETGHHVMSGSAECILLLGDGEREKFFLEFPLPCM